MNKLVLVRHGQSEWNKENRFTGWYDVDLSERGIREAKVAGQALNKEDIRFDLAFTSYLKRATRTLWMIMDELNQMYLPVKTDWRLNERHYGSLQGLNKKETTDKHGAKQVQLWRRGYTIRPPAIAVDSPMHPANDPRYKSIENPPAAESLADTLERVIPWWNEQLIPAMQQGHQPIVVAHGNSLRALLKYLDNISDEEIVKLNIPTGIPIVYEFDDQLNPVKHYYLASEEKLNSAVHEVSQQADH